MAKVRELCAMIHGNFDTESECARTLGWPRQKLNKITNGTREPTLEEVSQIAAVFQKPLGDIAEIFLRQKSPNGQQSA